MIGVAESSGDAHSSSGHSIFSHLQPGAEDPILSLNNRYASDSNTKKVNLAVGYYYDEAGIIPEMSAVKEAGVRLSSKSFFRGYLPIDGFPDYNRQSAALVLGSEHSALKSGRVVTVQTLGGTGGLALGAKLLLSGQPTPKEVWMSDPTWPNHPSIFGELGYKVNNYHYLNSKTQTLDFETTYSQLSSASAGAIVLLHVCCHNPTGLDFSREQWLKIFDLLQARNLIPFFDFAYQGFDEGIEADAWPIRHFAELGLLCLVSNSYSKSFSLYTTRVGALSVIAANAKEVPPILSRIKKIVRSNYSNPPANGAYIVAEVLGNQELRAQWAQELEASRIRMKEMRKLFVSMLKERGVTKDFGFILNQHGMFSMSGIDQPTIEWLRNERSIYIVDGGRICVAAFNKNNLGYVCDSIAERLA